MNCEKCAAFFPVAYRELRISDHPVQLVKAVSGTNPFEAIDEVIGINEVVTKGIRGQATKGNKPRGSISAQLPKRLVHMPCEVNMPSRQISK